MRRRKSKAKKAATPGFSEDALPYAPGPATAAPQQQSVELGAGGRLVIPAPMRAALGMKIGDRLNVRLENDELRIYSFEAGIRRVQEWARKVDPENKLSVDEFLAERRREAAKELKEFDG